MIGAEPRVRFWKPASELLPYVGNYHLYSVAPEEPGGTVAAVFFPGSATLRFKLTPDSSWQAQFRDDDDWQDLTGAILFGPSDGVTWSRTTAGIALGIGLTARGMAQFLVQDAAAYANRIVPAERAITLDLARISTELGGIDDDAAIAPLLDRVLLSALGAPLAEEAAIARLEAALADPDVRSVSEIGAAIGMTERSLQRFCRRHFGFRPHGLLRRTRFLRSLSAINVEPRGRRTTAIDARYSDYSHFIRDANYYLGMSPEEFLRRLTPVEQRAMLERAAIIGQQMHGLSRPPGAAVRAD